MTTGMFCEVITAHEFPLAYRTHKLLFSCVGSSMTGEFIRTCKPFITAIPTAAEGLLSCVCAKVGFKMGAFKISFSATRKAAHIISSARKVNFCGGSPVSCRYIDRGWCQR